jgi:monofunctional biosynthetic peptidoglycan transglycosylase
MPKKLLRVFLICVLLFVLYTVYCIFSIGDLCDLQKKNPKTTAFMELRKEQWEKKKVNRSISQRWVKLSAISRHLRNAVVVTEDPNFYHHHGIDFYAIGMAIEENLERKEVAYGASTITQQLMKNLYLSPSRNPFRKWQEAILALRVERCVQKNRLLEIYLNVIEWGNSVFGAEAAARAYFSKPAYALSPGEAALLAAMIRNPIFYNPYKGGSQLVKNRNLTLKWMWRRKLLNTEEYRAAINSPIHLK